MGWIWERFGSGCGQEQAGRGGGSVSLCGVFLLRMAAGVWCGKSCLLSPWSLPELSLGYGLIPQEPCETPLDTTFVALPGKWSNLSFNPSFDVCS